MKNKRFVFLFPGQGAQFVGMMKDFHDTFAESRQVFEEAEDVLKMSLKPIIFNGPKEVLTQTVNCQKAIFISSYAILKAFESRLPECIPQATCGLSLGEYTALAASGKARFSDLLPIVDKRATFMQKACEKTPSSMSVVLGQEGPWVEEVLRSIGLPVWVANLNCPGQVVIAGEIEPLAKAAVALKEAGAKRVLPLEVSGAFHTPLMESAKQALAPYLEDLKLQPSSTALVMNATGQLVKEAEEIRQLLIEQVTSPVYWAKGIQQLAPTTDIFIEMGPGNTLAGMNKRIGVEAPTYSIQTISELTTVLNTIEESYAT